MKTNMHSTYVRKQLLWQLHERIWDGGSGGLCQLAIANNGVCHVHQGSPLLQCITVVQYEVEYICKCILQLCVST